MTTLLFSPPQSPRRVPGVRRPIAYAMDTGPDGAVAELMEGLAPSNGQDFAPVFDEDDPEAGPKEAAQDQGLDPPGGDGAA